MFGFSGFGFRAWGAEDWARELGFGVAISTRVLAARGKGSQSQYLGLEGRFGKGLEISIYLGLDLASCKCDDDIQTVEV